MKSDNALVDYGVSLRELKHWRSRAEKDTPYYINTGESGLVFKGKPETVRNLWRTYNIQRYDAFMEFVSFLNEEGISARKVSAPIAAIFGYPIKFSYN